MTEARTTVIEQEPDGSTTEYDDIPVTGDLVERLLTEIFTQHWARITVGPVIPGAAWEIRFASKPDLRMMDGYLTVDTGSWHFHLCVTDTRAGGRAELARARRVARAAFFRTVGGSCVAESYGLRLWNGQGDQMTTVFFPNPFYDDHSTPLREPDFGRVELWEALRRRYRS